MSIEMLTYLAGAASAARTAIGIAILIMAPSTALCFILLSTDTSYYHDGGNSVNKTIKAIILIMIVSAIVLAIAFILIPSPETFCELGVSSSCSGWFK